MMEEEAYVFVIIHCYHTKILFMADIMSLGISTTMLMMSHLISLKGFLEYIIVGSMKTNLSLRLLMNLWGGENDLQGYEIHGAILGIAFYGDDRGRLCQKI